MKKALLMLAFTGLLAGTASAITKGDDKDKKTAAKKECCKKDGAKACAGDKKACCKKGGEATAATKPAEAPKK